MFARMVSVFQFLIKGYVRSLLEEGKTYNFQFLIKGYLKKAGIDDTKQAAFNSSLKDT